MKRIRIIACTAAAVIFAVSAASAQDAADDFGGDSGTQGETAPASSALSFGGQAAADFRAYVDEEDSDGGKKEIQNWSLSAVPSARLDAKYEGSATDAEVKLAFSEDVFKNHPADSINELTLRAYLGNFVLEGGKMKIVWGKGDKLHVIDNFNANDYTDFLIPDYIDRRLSEPMLHLVFNAPSSLGTTSSIRVEGVYTPFMTADRLGTGRWEPKQVSSLTSTVKEILMSDADYALTNNDAESLLTIVNNSNGSSLYPNLYQIKYGQEGVRITATTGLLDWGLSYYAGHNKQPSADLSGTLAASAKATADVTAALTTWAMADTATQTAANTAKTDAYKAAYTAAVSAGKSPAEATAEATAAATNAVKQTYAQSAAAYSQTADGQKLVSETKASSLAASGNSALPSLDYDQMQVFGAEGAITLGGINFRGEFAYTLTNDTAGDDPWTHNNSIGWVFGFDKDLPINNLNVNVQTTGTYVLKNDKIEDGAYKTYDVDYNKDGNYTNDKIVMNISDSYNHEKIKPEISAIYGIEHYDFIVMPKITVNVADGLDITAKGMYIVNFKGDDKSEFEAYQNNSFAQIGMKYSF